MIGEITGSLTESITIFTVTYRDLEKHSYSFYPPVTFISIHYFFRFTLTLTSLPEPRIPSKRNKVVPGTDYIMSNKCIAKPAEDRITLTVAPRALISPSRLRENFLLFSGLGLVLLAATMVAGAILT